jgi:DUF1365 family protein
MFRGNAIFKGTLLHRRYHPRRHELSYSVADVLVEVGKLEELNRTSWFLGYNSRRLLTISDRNHGPGDGTPIAVHVRGLIGRLRLPVPVSRVFMLCYPSLLGRVFNPLTVYFALAEDGRWLAVIYEVHNTFGQRHCYVMAVEEGAGHRARKCFYVSPFNGVEGEYRFGVERHGKHLRLNIALFEQGRLKLAARFEGVEQPLTDAAVLGALLRLVVQPFKVVAAIHWEALKLYLKGLRPTARPAHAAFSTSQVRSGKVEAFKP